MSEMEVASFRERAQAALKQKAQRGDFVRMPVGYVLTPGDRSIRIPDERVRAAIDLIFRKFTELVSARQLYFWLCKPQCFYC